ncbi:TRAPP trafficking subunit Trs65-domain-containing protein [Podospora didyma]|uniref:TRAPP trafficking subunit Trs65-domain-containing protein n=1 Tax=Podospora didyma TaxID=330526 RepID=A0AAE0P7D8_9PEZI|nr:TRAPP trafficking subunit Trs65-domain-containing protein [Podospora didyma]
MALSKRDYVGVVGHVDDASDAGRAFLENSYLTYMIPHTTEFNPEKPLQPGEDSHRDKFSGVEQRDMLFFDETVDVYLVLRTPCVDAQTLRQYLCRMVVTLDAHIQNSHAPDRDGPPASEPIFAGAVEDVQQAIIIEESQVEEDEDGGGANERCIYVVWKLPVFLCRPRIRLQAPSVVFVASAGLKPSQLNKYGEPTGNGYMHSGTPSGLNLLEAFADDPMLGGIKPRLSALRVSRVAPVTEHKDALRRIKGLQSLRLKIFPVAHTRVRFSRPNTSPPSPALIALLEVDFTPFFECEVVLNKITLNVTDGTVEDLNSQEGMALPLSCVAHDHLTFLYRLAPQQLDVISKNPTRDLVITIEVAVLVQPPGEPEPCVPRLTMTWTTNLDFTLPVNPGFGQPMTQPIQRSHRPSQLSISGGDQSFVAPSVSRPDALPSLEASTARVTETAIPDFGITMTFSGPDGPVYVGEEFRWTVFVVNRSKHDGTGASTDRPSSIAAAVPRKLALITVPRRRRNDLRVIRPPSTAGAVGSKRDPLVADAVLDENVVHAMQRSSVVDSTEVVCLSADVRVGPLAPNACAVVELRFLALREGVVGVEAVKVVDLGSQEHVDVRELPTVLVHRRQTNE